MRTFFLTVFTSLALLAAPVPIIFQAEDLPYRGDWQSVGDSQAIGKKNLSFTEGEIPPMPAVGFIKIPTAGRWRLWVRAKDFPKDRPGIRRFTVEINGKRAGQTFGTHGVDNPKSKRWEWEDGGAFELESGMALLALIPLTSYCRADVIALVPEGAKLPGDHRKILAMSIKPASKPEDELTSGNALKEQIPVHDTGKVLARLENRNMALIFTRGEQGGNQIVMLRVDRKRNDAWHTVLPPRPEVYDILTAEDGLEVDGRRAGILVNWKVKGGKSTVSHQGTQYQTYHQTGTGNPEHCGRLSPCMATTCEQVGDMVKLHGYGNAGEIHAHWRLQPNSDFPELTLHYTAYKKGTYGLRYTSINPVPREAVEEVTCPFLFSYKRLPKHPELIPTELTATPMATVQLAGPRTIGVAFNPDDLPKTWPDCDEFEAGFQLVTRNGRAQPSAWVVVPGGRGSNLKAGETVSGRLRLIAEDKDWLETYRKIARNLCELRDYRQNHKTSLTQALLNVISLMSDDEATGWSKAQMGFWNIESRNAVTHAAPLALVEAALLTGDEDLLARRAAPALAFLLSRPSCHVGADPKTPGRYGRYQLGKPTGTYGAAVRLSAWEMTGGYTPAFRDISFDAEGTPVRTGGVSPMDDALAAWHATGEMRYLEQAQRDARQYARDYLPAQTKEIPRFHFYQKTHTGNWRSLLAVAEATNDPELAHAAAEIARRMISGIYTWPKVQNGNMTIHRDNRTRTNSWCWFKGPKLFCLGWPEMTGDHPFTNDELLYLSTPEKQIPGWLPSVVGLGIEQPTTYRRSQGTCSHIIMANWAPHLLRLDRKVSDPLFTITAHNSTIGRWGTYPGYYRTDFTDLTQSPNYPLEGPDVSGIYWHHIPCFMMMLADYLVTDIEVRSKGKIAFPAARQCGYVWFDNRLFGHRPGRVYGSKGVWPWLPRRTVTIERPEINWFAGHNENSVFLFLTNTADNPVQTKVQLDLGRLDGNLASATCQRDNGQQLPLSATDGTCRATVSGNGLTVLRFRGLKARSPLQRQKKTPTAPEGYASSVETETIAGTVRANWIGFGPGHAFAHIYSDHQGKQATRAELQLEQNGTNKQFSRDFWPAEFLLPIDPGTPVKLTLTVIDNDNRRHRAPTLELNPPETH